ncbi:hypothetical protein BH11PLA2_BH11PLA2_09730 [soil metagenome]
MSRRNHKICQNKCAGRCVPVAFHHPNASDVRITGDFCNWGNEGVSLQRDEENCWRGVLKLQPGRYEYRYLADGVWQGDPECPERVPNAFGSENCVFSVV